ncbi:MAG: hypothetical protein AAB660_02250 [Patescibacteria group bacterium]
MNENKDTGAGSEGVKPEGFTDRIEYIDRKGSAHIFHSTGELMQFKQDENNPDNR